ncbi:hypothetical protein QBC34DRAFT_297082 [Podospora aff. communis PSN243]|uniref:Uncharacterized protein n=1 Tax=Podospora aff. communis PSN243 TaxID=3040156 RepID=A0AAV9GRC7_9PEZI|nr:hypothetical protein QBC34DRAFT_297082 [Podospora aff. communis PSN243]
MSANVSVYTGVWRDYSQDGANQLILTIPLRWGNVLISGLALLVSTAGAATWRISAFALHQIRVRHDNAAARSDSDPLQRQVQTLLRNNATPISALADALSIFVAWMGIRTPSSKIRHILPTAFLAAFVTILFGLFSIFVSAFATRSESNVSVLAKSGDACGGWEFNWSAISVTNEMPISFESLRARMDDVQAARSYATWFYSQGKQPLAVTNTMFPVPRLPYTVSMGPCPFLGEGRCLSNDTSVNTTLILDTGLLDSHVHLGINAPPRDRSNIRHRMECSPIDVSDVIQPLDPTNGTVTFNVSAIFRQPIFSATFPSNPQSLSMGYTSSSYWWSGATRQFDWPTWLTATTSADISAVLIAQNSVRYSSPVHDPLFLATNTSPATPGIYHPTHPFNLLACTQQVQFCNPALNLCTSLTHTAQAYNESLSTLSLSSPQKTAIERSALLLGLTDIGILGPATLGSAGLLARDSVFGDTFSLDLPPDQWTAECKLWFETKLALLQAHILRFLDRIDKTSPIYTNTLIYHPLDGMGKEEKIEVRNACQNMRIVTTGQYQNFQVWGVVFVVVLCAVVIGVSAALGTVVGWVRGTVWVTREGAVRERARERDGVYWLLRMAMEGEGVGPWSVKRGGGVPVVRFGDNVAPGEGSEMEGEGGKGDGSEVAMIKK